MRVLIQRSNVRLLDRSNSTSQQAPKAEVSRELFDQDLGDCDAPAASGGSSNDADNEARLGSALQYDLETSAIETLTGEMQAMRADITALRDDLPAMLAQAVANATGQCCISAASKTSDPLADEFCLFPHEYLCLVANAKDRVGMLENSFKLNFKLEKT